MAIQTDTCPANEKVEQDEGRRLVVVASPRIERWNKVDECPDGQEDLCTTIMGCWCHKQGDKPISDNLFHDMSVSRCPTRRLVQPRQRLVIGSPGKGTPSLTADILVIIN